MKWPGTEMMNYANQALILSEYGFRKSGEKEQEIAEVVKEVLKSLQGSLEGDGTGPCSCFRSWKGRLCPHKEAYLVGCRFAGQALPSCCSSSLSVHNPHPIAPWDHQFLL